MILAMAMGEATQQVAGVVTVEGIGLLGRMSASSVGARDTGPGNAPQVVQGVGVAFRSRHGLGLVALVTVGIIMEIVRDT